jgi:hypothetical protein
MSGVRSSFKPVDTVEVFIGAMTPERTQKGRGEEGGFQEAGAFKENEASDDDEDKERSGLAEVGSAHLRRRPSGMRS